MMFRWLFLAGFVLGVSPAFATEDADKGYEAAVKLCRTVGFADTVNECLSVIRDAEFLSEEAVGVCRTVGFSDVIIKCLKTIRDRRYTSEEVKTCSRAGFGESIVECFQSTGRGKKKPAEGLDKAFVMAHLKKALRLLKDGETERAQVLLEATLDGLK